MEMKDINMVINTRERKSRINKEIYGQFIEQVGRIVYDGLFVGKQSSIPNVDGVRRDVIEAFRAIGVPLLHWPGGGVADWYRWQDGIGPENERKTLINRWSNAVEDNSFGTHEFLNLCELLECEPYIVLNIGSATPRENHDWMEYMTFDGDTDLTRLRVRNGREKPWKLKYLAYGNEWWFYNQADQYADAYKKNRYYTKDYGNNHLFRILRGGHRFHYNFTDQLVQKVEPGTFDALTLYHVVYAPGGYTEGRQTDFTPDEYYFTVQNALDIDQAIQRQIGILRTKDANQNVKLAIDEWGTWYDATWDNANPDGFWSMITTMRDAMVAGIVLNIFNQHADVVEMASLCMSINALHSILLTKGEQMIKCPTYFVMKMYQQHQDSTLIGSFIDQDYVTYKDGKVPGISQSVSEKNGELHITLTNCSLEEDYHIRSKILFERYTACTARILTGDVHDTNTFDSPDNVYDREFSDFGLSEEGLWITLPRCSIVSLTLTK